MLKLKNIRCWLLATICLIPYIETGTLRHILSYRKAPVYWRSITSYLLIILVALCIFNGKEFLTKVRKKSVFFMFFFCFMFVRSIMVTNSNVIAVINQMIMIILPIVVAKGVILLVNKWDVNPVILIKRIIYVYVSFVLFTIFLNVSRYGMSINYISSFRLTASGGGIVPFGLTIAFMYTLFFINRFEFTPRERIIISAILLFASILNQSRSAMIVCLALTLYQFIYKKSMYMKVLVWLIFLAVAFFLVFEIDDLIMTYFPRFTSVKSSRTDTWVNCLRMMLKEPQTFFFGYGFDGFFKYQNWQSTDALSMKSWDEGYGFFVYNGVRFIIQPHNCFIYVLVESGILGLSFLISMIFDGIRSIYEKLDKLIVLVVFIIIASFDSVLCLEPGNAFLWWFILYLIGYASTIKNGSKLLCETD